MPGPFKTWLLKRRVMRSLDQLIFTLKFEADLSGAELRRQLNVKADIQKRIAAAEEEIERGRKLLDGTDSTKEQKEDIEKNIATAEESIAKERNILSTVELELQQAKLRDKQVRDNLTEHAVKVELLRQYRG